MAAIYLGVEHLTSTLVITLVTAQDPDTIQERQDRGGAEKSPMRDPHTSCYVRQKIMSGFSRFTLHDANAMLPLVQVICDEIVDRRVSRRRLMKSRHALERANTPEGLTMAIQDLDARIYEQDESLARAQRELQGLGLTVLRSNPVTVHFPGHANSGPVVFCWQEGEDGIAHGHPEGDEEDHRRPLRLRAKESG